MKEAGRLAWSGRQPSVGAIARAAGVSRTTFYRSFHSRVGLLAELKLEPPRDSRSRILEAALELLQTQSLAELSMDELAAAADISRANLYRLFPGKPALFRALLLAYSPFQPVMAVLQRLGERSPDEVIPQLVLAAYRTVAGKPGIARTILFEVTAMSPDSQQPFAETGLFALARVSAYLSSQMEKGRLRKVPPILALQSLIGGVVMHVLSTPVISTAISDAPAGEPAVMELAQIWLRGMRAEA
jgi:AcrR family transcriptional regulator